MSTESSVRCQLVSSLQGGDAFETFDQIVGEVPEDKRFTPSHGRGRSAWQIVEHMRRTLIDLVDYIDNADGSYKALSWPDDYWPTEPAPQDASEWDRSIEGFHAAAAQLKTLIEDEGRDLLAPFPWGKGQTLLHEALLAIQHSSYHLGELVELTATL